MSKTIDDYFGIKKVEENIEEKVIDGLKIINNFITEEEEKYLLDNINKSKWDTRLCRRTQHYGYEYDYKRYDCSKTDKIPEWCDFMINRIKKEFNNIPDQIIINEYVPGQGISPHTDAKIFGEYIFSLSLGSDINMNFTNKTDNIEYKLNTRSLLSMRSDARHIWKHSITQRMSDNGIKRKTRISLTFRSIK